MASVTFKNVYKVYEKSKDPAVIDFSFEIKDKEFVVLVGPSGCGKSTLLRMLAGLEEITQGEILIDDEVVNEISTMNRHISMVFQSYALYPHMSVFKNIAYPLKLRKVAKEEQIARVTHVATLLGLEELLERKPRQLSGGQRQRVALGRAIVRDDAKVLLMDEPLSNLDAKLRVQMRSEITKLHKKIETTIVYVTHDQVEAMTMADRIVIMDKGVIQQIGTPSDLYDDPVNTFVASFIGTPAMNFVDGTVTKDGYLQIDEQRKIKLSDKMMKKLKAGDYIEKVVKLGIRPSSIILHEKAKANCLKEVIDVCELLGEDYNIIFSLGEHQLNVRMKANRTIAIDKPLYLEFDSDKLFLFDTESGLRIY